MEAVWGKSGEGMAEVLMASFGEGIDKVTLVDTEKGPMEQRVLQIGLDIAHKVIAVAVATRRTMILSVTTSIEY
jgi:hypothetical protein